jgi:hypothetical protein
MMPPIASNFASASDRWGIDIVNAIQRALIMTKTLLIIWDSMTGGSKALAMAAEAGARTADGAADGQDDLAIICRRASDASADDMLSADGYIFAFPENLAAISGGMKSFFDRCYYPCLGRIEGRSYALLICAGSDGQNAAAQAQRIATGWRLKPACDAQIICTHAQTPEAILALKHISPADLARAHEVGGLLAAGLTMGIF